MSVNHTTLLITCLSFCLSACDGNNENSNSTPSLSSFNLTKIEASHSDIKSLTLTWTPASNSTSVYYTVCEKDISKPQSCTPLISVFGKLTATIKVESVFKAINREYFVLASLQDKSLASSELTVSTDTINSIIGFFKASNVGDYDIFGFDVSLSDNGALLAVGAHSEDSPFTSISTNGVEVTTPDDGTADDSGAVYLFGNSLGRWNQITYIKASNSGTYDHLGYKVALSGDGNTLVASAPLEGSTLTGVITDGSEVSSIDDGSSINSGAVYLFKNVSGTWQQTAYFKASNPGMDDYFGRSLAISDDGNTLAIGASAEDSQLTGTISDGSETSLDDNSAPDSGAVYVFKNFAGTWSQQAYLKASNAESGDLFGSSVSLSGDGQTLAVGAVQEDDIATNSGAVYIYQYSTGNWIQSAYLKASNSGEDDYFGSAISMSADGTCLVVSAKWEDSQLTGIIDNGDEMLYADDGSASKSGAVYVFNLHSGLWVQQAYIKASNTGANDNFGYSVSLSDDSSRLVVGAITEDSQMTGITTDASEISIIDNGSANGSGAVYLFSNTSGVWSQNAYIKSSNSESLDGFGASVTISGDGLTLAVGAVYEDSQLTGVISDDSELEVLDDGSAINSGAVYLY